VRADSSWRPGIELHRAIIYTTEMSKQVTKNDVGDAVHKYSVN
jgi:hypothetical protein